MFIFCGLICLGFFIAFNESKNDKEERKKNNKILSKIYKEQDNLIKRDIYLRKCLQKKGLL